MADTSLSAEEQRQIEKEKAHEKAVSDSIQGLFAGGLGGGRDAEEARRSEPEEGGRADVNVEAVGLGALPPAAERRGSVGMLDDDAAEKTKKRMGSFGGDGGMTFGGASFRTTTSGSGVKGRQKVKYCRAYTIVYGKEQKEEKKEHARWSLIQEARKYTDLSVGGLHEMYESFAAVAPAGGPVISPRQFRGVLSRHGIRDPVLVQRLFAEFMEKEPSASTTASSSARARGWTTHRPRRSSRSSSPSTTSTARARSRSAR